MSSGTAPPSKPAFLSGLRERVSGLGPVAFVMYAGLSAFAVYSSMYAFRKGFTADSYDSVHYWGVSLKVFMLAAQSLGYMISKIYGIRFIGELGRTNRHRIIIGLVFSAWMALFFFGITPAPYNLVFMFLNGLPLGLVWGVVFSYLEGRTTTELLGGILSTSLIFSAGLVRTVGKGMMLFFGSASWWMPFVTGAVFFIPVVICSLLLEQIPPPNEEDVRQRSVRRAMNREQRMEFLRFFARALVPAIGAYVMISVLRDVRDNFSNEIWVEAGYGNNPGVFTATEAVVAVIVLVVIGSLFRVRDNFKAFRISHGLVAGGLVLSAVATFLHQHGMLPVFGWMIFTGAGLYIAYLPFSCVYFERMIATYRVNGNVGFMVYMADSLGYFGAIVVLVIKEFGPMKESWVGFLGYSYYVCCGFGILLLILAYREFGRIHNEQLERGEAVPPDGPHEDMKPYPEAL